MNSNVHQSVRPDGRTGFRPRVMGAAAGVTVLVLVAVGALTDRPSPNGCATCGTVHSIKKIEVTGATAEPTVVVRCLTNAVAERQVDDAATTVETAAEASAREGIGKGRTRPPIYRITVQMDDGSYRVVSLPLPPAFAVGDKVRVVESKFVRA